jgi:hypothetical protein
VNQERRTDSARALDNYVHFGHSDSNDWGVLASMSEESRQRRNKRWAARYAKSQAAFDARGRDSELAGGWVERISGSGGVPYRIDVIPPGEPVGRDYWFYVMFSLSLFVKGWFPPASNEDWVVEVQLDQRRAAMTRVRFRTYLEALEYVRQARLVVTTGRGSLESLRSS